MERTAIDLPVPPRGVSLAAPPVATVARAPASLPRSDGPFICLSILMPVFNEERTVARAVASVLAVDYPCPVELLVVDDGSSDATPEILRDIADSRARVLRHPQNRGKGAALRTAVDAATGTHVVPFDADLEYSPADLPDLLAPVLEGRCDVVYGTRLFGARTVYQSYRHAMGNRLLTATANILFDAYISDLHTCLKLVPRELFRSLQLSESGFGLDTELTARILKLGVRPFEVPVSYHSRDICAGKKINWRDGLKCLQLLSSIRFAHASQRLVRERVIAEPSAPLAASEEPVATALEVDVHWVTGLPPAKGRVQRRTSGRLPERLGAGSPATEDFSRSERVR
jgi:dolichol-phosphate hexosyltransferase